MGVEKKSNDLLTPGNSPDGDQCIVAGAHAFVLRVSSFFGMAPLKFKPRGNGYTVTLSNYMCIYSYLLVTVLAAIAFFGIASEVKLGINPYVHMSSYLSQVVSCCDITMVAIMASTGVYGAPGRMRSMLKFMSTIASVDKSIGGQYSHAKERRLWAGLIFFLFFFTMLIVDDICFYALQARAVNREWDVVVHYIGFYLLWYLVMILELQFAFTAMSVRARFQAVNDALGVTARHLSVPNTQKAKSPDTLNIFAIRVAPADQQSEKAQMVIIRKTVTGEPRLVVPPSDAVHRIASLHGALCDVVHRIDNSYSIPLVVILISTLLHLIVTPYFTILEINVRVSNNRLHFVILQCLWTTLHMLRLFVVVEPCHYTIVEGRKTESLVCRMMMAAPASGALPARLELFSRQLLLQSISYKPMGMCTLDRPLVASIFGAVATYLVILIQFQRYDT